MDSIIVLRFFHIKIFVFVCILLIGMQKHISDEMFCSPIPLVACHRVRALLHELLKDIPYLKYKIERYSFCDDDVPCIPCCSFDIFKKDIMNFVDGH